MKRKIKYGLFGLTSWHPCRVKLHFIKALDIKTIFDGVDWVASAFNGLISSDTKIYDPADKTEKEAIKSLRRELVDVAVSDAIMYRKGDWTEKGAKSYIEKRDALKEYLPEGWFEFMETLETRLPIRIPKNGKFKGLGAPPLTPKRSKRSIRIME